MNYENSNPHRRTRHRLVGIDVAGSNVNTMGTPVLWSWQSCWTNSMRNRPRGVVFHLAEVVRFHRGRQHPARGDWQGNDVAAATKLILTGYDLYERLRRSQYPTLALIKGFCMGGGLELAMACRYRVAVDDPGTRLGLPGGDVWHSPGLGRCQAPTQLVGAPAAFDLMLSGKTVDAKKARSSVSPTKPCHRA